MKNFDVPDPSKPSYELSLREFSPIPTPHVSPRMGPPRRAKVHFHRPNMGNMLSSLLMVFTHFATRSTVHGLNHFSQAKSHTRRLLWLMVACSASLGFCINMKFLIEKYVANPVLTNVYHDHENFQYPDISFCIMNPIYFPPKNSSAHKQLVDAIQHYHQMSHSFRERFSLADYLYMMRYRNYTHYTWSAIMKCRFRFNECHPSFFNVIHIWPHGACFMFNISMHKHGRTLEDRFEMRGLRPDFRLTVYKAVDYPVPYDTLDPHGDLSVPSGILVMLHEPRSFPHIKESFVLDGSSQIDLRITMKSHLPIARGCQKERRNITYMDVHQNKSFTFLGRQLDCTYSLFQNAVFDKCHCVKFNMPVQFPHASAPFCLDAQHFNHSNEEHRRKREQCTSRYMGEVSHAAKAECQRDFCHHATYTTVISNSNFPAVKERHSYKNWLMLLETLEQRELAHFGSSDMAEKALLSRSIVNHNITSLKEAVRQNRKDLLNVDFVERNFMFLRVVPGSMLMDLVEEEEEYPLSRLLADLGGCVGLWLGASLITIFEFFDFFLEFLDVLTHQHPPPSAFKTKAPQWELTPKGRDDCDLPLSSCVNNRNRGIYPDDTSPLWNTLLNPDDINNSNQDLMDTFLGHFNDADNSNVFERPTDMQPEIYQAPSSQHRLGGHFPRYAHCRPNETRDETIYSQPDAIPLLDNVSGLPDTLSSQNCLPSDVPKTASSNPVPVNSKFPLLAPLVFKNTHFQTPLSAAPSASVENPNEPFARDSKVTQCLPPTEISDSPHNNEYNNAINCPSSHSNPTISTKPPESCMTLEEDVVITV